MAQASITSGSGSNGVRSDASLSTWNDARTDDPAKETTTFITQASTSFQCGRYFAFFDLSSIPASSTIDSATLVHPSVSNVTDDDSGSVHVVEHVATDPVAVGDFKNYKSLDSDTSFGSVDVTDLDTGGTTDITINSDGLTYIEGQFGATAKIGLRSSEDFDNSAPSGNSQYTTDVDGFQLDITYTPAATDIQGFFNV